MWTARIVTVPACARVGGTAEAVRSCRTPPSAQPAVEVPAADC
jgi:hypothetical protein